MIRRTLRFGIRLGLLAGIGLALFKLIQGRRSASELGSPSADWAPTPVPAPNPNLPKTPPEPELVKPVMLEEVIEKKAAAPSLPPEVTIEPPPAPAPKKASPAKKAAAKKAAAPAAAGPEKKVAPEKAPVAKKAAPVKKAPKKQP